MAQKTRQGPPTLCLERLDRTPICWQAPAPLSSTTGFLFELEVGEEPRRPPAWVCGEVLRPARLG